jgi:hypothetical protein
MRINGVIFIIVKLATGSAVAKYYKAKL